MKNLILICLGLLSALTLISSTSPDLKKSANNKGYCPGPSQVYLTDANGHEFFPGEHALDPNELYYVHVIGGENSQRVCVTGGGGYVVNGISGCTDLGDGQDGVPTSITTNSNISGGLNIGIYVYCTSGNGTWFGDFYF
jgi:hypothetical protein